jgi:hypothetical protein
LWLLSGVGEEVGEEVVEEVGEEVGQDGLFGRTVGLLVAMSDSPDILHSLHLLFDNTFVYNAKQVHFAYLPVCGTYVFEVAEMCLVEPKIH